MSEKHLGSPPPLVEKKGMRGITAPTLCAMGAPFMRRVPSRVLYAAISIALVGGLWFAPGATPEAVGKTPPAHYVGNARCATCHFKQSKSWIRTPMAKAFTALKPGQRAAEKKAAGLDPKRDYTTDTRCLACHTTGYGESGGYPAVVPGKAWSKDEQKRARRLRGVSCEACHGAGSLYTTLMRKNKHYQRADVVARGLIASPAAKDCTCCHDGTCPTMPKGYRFDFEKAAKAKNVHAHVKLRYPH